MAITGTEDSEVLVGTENDDTINGLGGDDTLQGLGGNDILDGGEGADTMEGGQGDDTYRIDDPNDVVIELADEGYDHVNIYTTMVFDFGENIESAYTNRPTTLIGNDGANYLGGSGGSTLIGGLGNDYYLVAANAKVIEEVDGGIDTVSVTGNYTLPENVENLINENSSYALGWTYVGNSLNNIMIGYQGPETISGLDGDDQIYADPITGGTAFGSEDKLYGGNGSDILYAVRGNDSLYGEAGKDELHSGLGNDLLDGGAGNDTASYIDATSGVRVNLFKTDGQNTLSAGYDTLISIENLVGSDFDDKLVGNDVGNRIEGLGGNDKLYGFGGRDVIVAGAGNDRVEGGFGKDRIIGDEGNDRLYGDAGDDLIYGNEGNDRINGGNGIDEMRGGSGDDIYFVDNVGDIVFEASSNGTDRVVAGIDYTLTENVEVLRMRTGDYDGTGNGLDNLIRGLGGANVLDGAAGDDDIYGGTGNDTLIGGDGIDRLAGEVGSDILTGGADKDFFIFNAADELGDRVNISDIITDFTQADGDLINVRGIDADTTLEGNQNFAFIGDEAFSGAAGELRYYQSASRTFVEMDLDGDGVGDLFIRLDGVIDLTAGDFVL